MAEPLVHLRDLVKQFPVTGGIFHRQVATVDAVSGVTMNIRHGETIGLVGESGCGKSTVATWRWKIPPVTGNCLTRSRR